MAWTRMSETETAEPTHEAPAPPICQLVLSDAALEEVASAAPVAPGKVA